MFKKFKIKTFGCQMNIYDSQKISDIFYKIGFKNTLSDEDADIYVINTCHIRNKAKQKLYSELGKIYKIKKNRYENKKKTILIVAGCVAQAEGKEIFKRAPYGDIIVGSQSYQKIPKLLKKINKKAEEKVFVELDFEPKSKFDELPKDKFTNEISSYLTIQEGCNKFCKFCVVPYTRGPEYSRSVEEIVDEAKSLVSGIEWRNTMENYAHFGVVAKTEASNSELLDDMIAKIVNVLDKTDAIQDDPLEGNFGQIYYDGILRSLYSDNFHPSISNSELEDIDLGGEATALPKVRAQKQLVALGQSDWQKLKPVATMKVRPIQFGRGNARIQRNSQRSLVALADDLKSFPHWYIKVIGHTRSAGNRKAHQDLAQQRADATAKFLMKTGISNSRIPAAAVGQPPANATGGQAQSVTFMLLEKPY